MIDIGGLSIDCFGKRHSECLVQCEFCAKRCKCPCHTPIGPVGNLIIPSKLPLNLQDVTVTETESL